MSKDMIMSRANTCFPHNPHGVQMYDALEEMMFSSPTTTITTTTSTAVTTAATSSDSLFCSLSVLRDKVEQMESIVSIIASPNHMQRDSFSAVIASGGTLVQDIIVAASSMIFAFQQLNSTGNDINNNNLAMVPDEVSRSLEPNMSSHCVIQDPDSDVSEMNIYGGGDNIGSYQNNNNDDDKNKSPSIGKTETHHEMMIGIMSDPFQHDSSPAAAANDVIELDAANLLAKYTHYCHVCGKGFKRDANLRMHMRAHGDEYKTNTALSNTMKNKDQTQQQLTTTRKYSCPQEGCRWNKKHVKFQPLKSMVCVKNHYRRSHCPKMYVCNRCNRKQFSVLSDLRTHEKHCGDLRWQCSCGTSFSRKDKLMGHVALFVGHAPVAVAAPLLQKRM